MGQVLNTIGIIGDGRMARHFSHYLRLSEIPFRSWSRRTSAQSPEVALGECPVILALIRDDAIVPFIEEQVSHGFRTQRRWIHFSGSLVTPSATGYHPLATFGTELYALETYRRIPFIVEKDGPAFREVLPSLPNPSFALDPEKKPLYHALCVLSGNFTTLLWQKLFRELEGSLGIPREAALPYLERIVGNLRDDPARALTGPLARGDQGTLARNRAALEGDPYQQVFDAFVRAYSEVMT